MNRYSFRVWYDKDKVFCKVVEIGFVFDKPERIDCLHPITGDLINLHNVPLMQNTTVKDKNGKEIYEGDIVKVKDREEWRDRKNPENIGVVEWNDEEGEYHVKGTYIEYVVGCWDWAIEIIGNIFENPDLIKGLKL